MYPTVFKFLCVDRWKDK